MKIFTVPEKYRAMAILVNEIVQSVARATKLVARILDDSEVSVAEAAELANEGKSQFQQWSQRDSGKESKS